MTDAIRRVAIGVVLLLCNSFGAHAAHAWSDEGHQIVAAIAADRLNPHATAAVQQILAHDATGQTLVAVSTWADLMRSTTMPETYNWHFVNIPVDTHHNTYKAARDCKLDTKKGDCIIAALGRELPKLTDATVAAPDRANALKFITHLIGDLHQPLHCAERNGDLGANDVKVTFFGQKTQPSPFKDQWNLHAVWDAGLIDHSGRSQTVYVKQLETWIASQNVTNIESGTPIDWANESHAAAVSHAYKSGSKDFPVSGGKVGSTYYHANIGVVDQQLAKGGVRLAKVLNDAFP
jgi:nuclease S1